MLIAYEIDDNDKRVTAHPNYKTIFPGTWNSETNKIGVYLRPGKNFFVLVKAQGQPLWEAQYVRVLNFNVGKYTKTDPRTIKVVTLKSNTPLKDMVNGLDWGNYF